MAKKLAIPDLAGVVDQGTPLTMITCYDYANARLVDRAGVDIVLVSDSLAMTVLGEVMAAFRAYASGR